MEVRVIDIDVELLAQDVAFIKHLQELTPDERLDQCVTKKEVINGLGVSLRTYDKFKKLGLKTIDFGRSEWVRRRDLDAFLEKYKRS